MATTRNQRRLTLVVHLAGTPLFANKGRISRCRREGGTHFAQGTKREDTPESYFFLIGLARDGMEGKFLAQLKYWLTK